MHSAVHITDVHFSRSSDADARAGLLGWVSLKLGRLVHVDGVALRRTRQGRITLSFPERRDARGRRHSIIRPIDGVARETIEAAVLAALADTGVTL